MKEFSVIFSSKFSRKLLTMFSRKFLTKFAKLSWQGPSDYAFDLAALVTYLFFEKV